MSKRVITKIAVCVVFTFAYGSMIAANMAKQEIWYHPAASALECPDGGSFIRLNNGEIITVDDRNALISRDEGKSWEKNEIFSENAPYDIRGERVLIQTTSGTVILAFINNKDRSWKWNRQTHDTEGETRLPTCVIRSEDNGRTWKNLQVLHTEWTGAIRDVLQTKSGKIVFTGMIMLHNPGRHATLTYSSDDDGMSWTRSNIIDLGGMGDHGGVVEATIEELSDGRIWMLMRTNWDYFWEAFSEDEGVSWRTIHRSNIKAGSAPGLIHRLADGRLVLVWNQLYPHGKSTFPRTGGDGNWSEVPASNHRKELSICFSDDEGKSWSEPIVIGRVEKGLEDITYPFIFEKEKGILWITVMRGEFAAQVDIKQLEKTGNKAFPSNVSNNKNNINLKNCDMKSFEADSNMNSGIFSVTEGTPLPATQARGGHAGGLLDGKVIITGGTSWSQDKTIKSFLSDSYILENGRWEAIADLPTPLAYSMYACDDSGLYVVGGTNDGVSMRQEAFVLKSAKDKWTRLPDLSEGMGFGSGAIVNGEMYVVGGVQDNGKSVNRMYRLDLNNPQTKGWQSCSDFPGDAKILYSLVSNGEYLYLLGGLSGSSTPAPLSNVFQYNPQNNKWIQLADLPFTGYAWDCQFIDKDHMMMTGRAADGKIYPDIWSLRLTDMTATKVGELIIQSTTAPLIRVKSDEWWLVSGEPDSDKNRTEKVSVIKLARQQRS